MFGIPHMLIGLVALLAFQTEPPKLVNALGPCDVPAEVSAGLAQLAWEDFEFANEPGRPMWFAGRGCYAQAAGASQDYLANGPLLDVRQMAISLLHMGRNTAFAGDEKTAARIVAAARRSDQAATANLDWNSYVQGLYGFLAKDRALLDRSHATLARAGGEGNQGNAANLSRLRTCFDKPYLEAMNAAACAAN